MTFPIPDGALDGRLGIVGLTGSGKTNTAKGGVERLLELGRRVCIVDLLDGWWGLRLGRDGKKPAYPVVIFGGGHGDLPINEHAGAVVGQAVAQSHESVIVSLSEIDTDEARRRFARAFFDALHRFNRAPIHLVIDEADFYAPQQPMKESNASFVLNRVKEIAARGRMRGFRAWVITQRPAKLHKDVLSQCDTLVAMQLTASQDREAIDGWIGDQADRKTGKEILATLPRLKRGQGILWSPRLDILAPTFFPLSATYDSGRTPDYGEQTEAVTLAPINLGALKERLATVETEAAENDPKALKATIRELESKLASSSASSNEGEKQEAPDTDELDRLRADNDNLSSMLDEMEKERDGLKGELETERAGAEELRSRLSDIGKLAGVVTPIAAPRYQEVSGGTSWRARRPAPVERPRPAPKPHTAGGPGEKMAKAERLVLTALAQYPQGRSKTQVAILAGYAVTGGGFNNALSACRSQGWIEGAGDHLTITDAGLRALGSYEPLPHGRALLAHWLANVGKAERMVLEAVAKAWPRAMTKEEVAAATNYEASGGGFNNALSRLRTLELISRGQDIRASDSLFDRARVR